MLEEIYLCKIHFNISFPSTPTPPKQYLQFRFLYKNFVCISRLQDPILGGAIDAPAPQVRSSSCYYLL